MTDTRTASHNLPAHQCLQGAHLSIAGGLEKALLRAAALDCTALQIFTKNASLLSFQVLAFLVKICTRLYRTADLYQKCQHLERKEAAACGN